MNRAARVRFDARVAGHLGLEESRLALYAWLAARSQGGELVLSIDDLTGVGGSAVDERPLLEDLLWLGLGWDEGSGAGGERGLDMSCVLCISPMFWRTVERKSEGSGSAAMRSLSA